MASKLDGFEGVRFGCGAFVGAVLGVIAAIKWLDDIGWARFAAAAAVVMLLFGWLAMRYGDRFWESARHWLWFWP